MCICDKIEVAKTAIDETTILEIKAIITLHSYLKFDKVSCAIKAKKSAKKCAARSGFKVLVSNSKAALPFKTILNTTNFESDDFVEKSTILWKTRDENDVRRYPHTQRLNTNVRRSGRFALRTFQNSSSPRVFISGFQSTKKCFP